MSHAVAALFALALAAARADAQELLWPVHSNAAPRVSQAFGEFGDGSSTKYHAGLDLAVAVGTDVFPVAEGELAFVQRVSPNGSDHGFGNTVILLHRPPAKPRFFSQYSHLSSIEDKLLNACKPDRDRSKIETPLTCVTGATWTTEQTIGKSGHSASGLQESPEIPPHLHLEIKTFGTLCASIPNEPGCGYATVQPWTIGYSDPVNGLLGVAPFAHSFPVAVTASGVSVRFTPDAGADKRAITAVSRDAANPLRAIAWSGGYPPCESEGWIQVRRADNPLCAGASGTSACFADTLDKLVVPSTFRGLVPTAWICAKYLTPEKTSDARRAVTEGTLFSGGSVKVQRAAANGLSVELSDRDGLFTVYEIPQLPNAATDFWNLILLDVAHGVPPYANFADNQHELVVALLARFAAGCATDPDVKRQAECAVKRMANVWKVRIGGADTTRANVVSAGATGRPRRPSADLTRQSAIVMAGGNVEGAGDSRVSVQCGARTEKRGTSMTDREPIAGSAA